jgi:hypothetical protein
VEELSMLSKTETTCSASELSDSNPNKAYTDPATPPNELGFSDEWSESENESFFYVAMNIGGPGGRALRRAASLRGRSRDS